MGEGGSEGGRQTEERRLCACPDSELVEGAAPVGVSSHPQRTRILPPPDGEGRYAHVRHVGGGGRGREGLRGGGGAVEEEGEDAVLVDGGEVGPDARHDGPGAGGELPEARVAAGARAGEGEGTVGGVGARVVAAAVEKVAARDGGGADAAAGAEGCGRDAAGEGRVDERAGGVGADAVD